MVRIMHIGDVHLDSPFSCSDMRKSELRKVELRTAFSSVLDKANAEKVDIVLISGDLFDSENVTRETASFLQKKFAENNTCRFVISPGNHDPFTENSVYAKVRFPSNVYIFRSSHVSRICFDDLKTDIYGYAFEQSEMENVPFAGVSPVSPDRINILCAHGDMISEKSHTCPIRTYDIERSGFDYVALGHIHNGTEIKKAGESFYAYCGCLEGRDFGECGEKGGILCSFEKKDGELQADFRRFDFSKRKYAIEKINVTGAKSSSDVLPLVKKTIEEKGYDQKTLLRIVLEGEVSPDFVLGKTVFDSVSSDLFYFELVDKTRPFFDVGALKSDPTIRGAFYKELLPYLESDDEKTREIGMKALRYGLSSLAGNSIIEF